MLKSSIISSGLLPIFGLFVGHGPLNQSAEAGSTPGAALAHRDVPARRGRGRPKTGAAKRIFSSLPPVLSWATLGFVAADPLSILVLKRKPAFPIRADLRSYLAQYTREVHLPLAYEDLLGYVESIPLRDSQGRDTLWETVTYQGDEMRRINSALTRIYALVKAAGDMTAVKHLYVDRVDFCAFGNSQPFRIRIVNSYNDNQDYYYVKRADASRVYGLELEHLLSPNRMHYLTCGETLVEEHVVGIPGDTFIREWLNSERFKAIRVAKELVKFNERCFVRLLGDMRSYNFVVDVTPDFEGVQVRIRAMDFDQQSHHGRKNFYLPQFFPENRELALFCMKHLNIETAAQYQWEEDALIIRRTQIVPDRLKRLLDAMEVEPMAPEENIHQLRLELAEHHRNDAFLRCETMGALVRTSLETIQQQLQRPLGRNPFQMPGG
jgi:hypothetical protein